MNPDLIRRFFEGKCSPEEAHAVLLWINSDAAPEEIIDGLDDYQEQTVDPIDSEKMLARIQFKVDLEDELAKEGQRSKIIEHTHYKAKNKVAKIRRTWVAACFLALITGFGIWINLEKEEKVELAQTPIRWVNKQTSKGQKLTLSLPDGSTVMLNSNSSIIFPSSFSDSIREVKLIGEAFFEVSRDPLKPFIVTSQSASTQVFGTSFVVRDFKDSRYATIGVLTGKVGVHPSFKTASGETAELIDLLPMQGVRVARGSTKVKRMKLSYDEMFAWKDNVIAFAKADFKEVILKLEDWYGVSFEVNRKISPTRDFTGKFDGLPLDQTLDGLSLTFGFDFRIENKKVIIF
ncbi:iron dicitrate transporter FecR [Echinicola pacifica]|uniref:Iron dicitrate transporter FecR n=1 Tax=Echinicola pacifica TaxID=346377 RepID=A0A918Q458_9BACT|nr:FecR family protein [Echinicola pacifica]GGZ30557.1 iron dicitrate transporter FecR [Echinicola pacifica]